jgi:outer membrane receptor protein involved in Fe transport
LDNYKITAGFDSFTNKTLELDLTQNIDSIPFSLKARKISSEGTYSFKIGDRTEERANSYVESLDATLASVFGLWDFTLKPRIMLHTSKRGSPEPVINGTQRPSNAFLKESDLIAMISADNYINEKTTLKLGAIYNYSDLQYKNSQATEFGLNGLDNDFFNNSLQVRADYTSRYKNLSYGFTADAEASTLQGDMIEAVGDINRENIALAGNLSYTKKSVVIEYSFYSSFRADYSSKFSANYSPMVGLSANVVQAHLVTKAAITTGYRLPSFNEMYYLNYGNQDLQPEKSITYNIGLNYSPRRLGLLGLNFFYTKTKDQISSVPTGPITWQSQNIDRVNTKGIEFTAALTPIDGLDISYNYIYQQPIIYRGNEEEKLLLPYTPEEIISGLVAYGFADYRLGLSFQYKSYVFTTIDNDLSLLLDSYSLFDFFVAYSPELYGGKLNLRLDLRNILDKQYQIFINYPMPGRNIRGTVSYEI